MPAPSSSLATLRPDLGGSMEEFDFAADQAGYIGLRVLPVIESQKQSGTFGKIPVEELLKEAETQRAPGAGYSRGNWQFEPTTFGTVEHGFEEPVDDRESEMYADYFDAELVSAARARATVLRNYEKRVASLVFNTTTWTATSATNEWDDATNGTPIDDVEGRVQAIYDACGLWADTLIISKKVFRNLRNSTQVINRITASGAGDPAKPSDITVNMLAQVFDLPKILVGGGTENSANEGQTFAAAEIWDDEYAMVCKTMNTNEIREPGLGRTIHWAEDGSQVGTVMESYRDEPVRSDIIRARMDSDELIFHTPSAALLDNITS